MGNRKVLSMTKSITQAVILAGGMGTRLFPLSKDIPKAMIPFYQKPFLRYLIERLVDQGIKEVLILTGYKADIIEDYFEDGSEYGIKIHYSRTPVEDNTGTRIRKAFSLFHDQFFLLYCDNYWPFDLAKLEECFLQGDKMAQVVIYNNKDSYTKNNVLVEGDRVKVYDKKRITENLQGVDIGFILLKKEAIEDMPKEDFLFETYLFPKLIEKGQLGAFHTGHRYYSVGSFNRLELTRKFLAKPKYVLVDRDGVLNEKAPKADYIKSWSEWRWKQGAIEGLQYLVQKGFKLIIVTNQAGIAREKMSENDLHSIHFNMKEDLSAAGVSIEKIYFCPHGWDDDCDCRKPKPGMLWQAQRDFHLDLSSTFFIGDDPRDIETAEKAGSLSIFVKQEDSLIDIVKNYF